MAQGIRPSQYITTFGPGALVETPMGPHILLSTEDVLRRIHQQNINMEELAIRDQRLQRGLLEGDRIFKLPDSQGWERFRYPTKKFPTWNLCVQHPNFNVIHRAEDGCAECTVGVARNKSKKNRHAIRFLVACPNGHLDDVNWPYLIHLGSANPAIGPSCDCRQFRWIGSGSSLSAIRIECPRCNASRELGEIYSYRLRCRGRRPERAGTPNENCTTDQAIVVQRGSFQLRLPEVITSLTIPPLVRAHHRVLEREDLQTLIKDLRAVDRFTESVFRGRIQSRVQDRQLSLQLAEQLAGTSWDEILQAIGEIESVAAGMTLIEYLRNEHQALMRVMTSGFPPYPHDNERRAGEPISFQVEATAIRQSVRRPGGSHAFRVMPIERLRVVMVQAGFRRVEYTGPASVRTPNRGVHPQFPERTWLPGVEQFGEGIYIDLAIQDETSSWYPEGPAAQRWDATMPPSAGPTDLVQWNALSVWWHTLSHRLINAMSLHSGYSSTAIRERLYLSSDDHGQRGGVLLYTTQPGGDGTMGGLTSLVPDFERILEMALEGVDRCSNDPLCEHAEIDPVSKLGAACYSCQLVSETSCEHYNGYLHRCLLLENMP